ncbi:protein of unknown function [Jannaschia faecimaris]|uniref:DUF3859 domain-containing protein n=1 Tax=Jannaschia faecimaris TaxID=1244108 RepID=A0A1H3U2R5_9RHOB|nr:DUF3859 domain-containing protein [Jannaschia faecimaris]SDZ55829.1 protein of unknown function [Jannaschia faecimaris]
MRHRLKSGLTGCFIALCATPAVAQVEMLRAGVVCPDGRDGPLRDAPGTLMGGVREIADLTIDVETRDVPLIRGLGLGVQTRWTGAEDQTVQMVTLHPPMGGGGVTRQEYGKTMQPGGVSTRAYTFEFAYEMVPGVWTLQVEDGTGILNSVEFTVSTSPNRAVTEACGLFFNS